MQTRGERAGRVNASAWASIPAPTGMNLLQRPAALGAVLRPCVSGRQALESSCLPLFADCCSSFEILVNYRRGGSYGPSA